MWKRYVKRNVFGVKYCRNAHRLSSLAWFLVFILHTSVYL